MSLIKAVKWFAIYVLLTLVFTAITALGAFIYVRVSVISHEFNTMFFLFLFLMGAALAVIGGLVIFRVQYLTFEGEWASNYDILRRTGHYFSRRRKVRTERRYGILLIVVGLTFIIISLTQF